MSEYRIQVHDSPTEIPAADWDGLLGRQKHPTPFMRHAYLSALEASGSATPATGWDPKFLTLWHNGDLHAGLALYLKSHSYGEYVFDWAWADAHHRHRLPYYPKALAAVPFTPVPGTRLLADPRRPAIPLDPGPRAPGDGLFAVAQRHAPTQAQEHCSGTPPRGRRRRELHHS